jgi:prepilin-type N-terminal cleavage/methylation domain-containing protein
VNNSHSHTTRRAARAFTLIEVLIVLALLVILAALAVPAMDRPLATQTLRSGVDDVRTAWVQARLAAMKTGQTFVFRYAPGGDHYVVECQVTPEMAVEQEVEGFSSSGDASQDQAVAENLKRYEQDLRLREHLHFDQGSTTVDARAQSAAESMTNSDASAADSQLTWSDAIFFYPDGTTSTAVIRLENKYGRMIELSLRGLTGVASIGPIQDAPADVSTGSN